MRLYRVRWWTGPTRVDHYVSVLQALGNFAQAVFGGTEHVYFTILASDEWHARIAVEAAIGKSFCRVEAL